MYPFDLYEQLNTNSDLHSYRVRWYDSDDGHWCDARVIASNEAQCLQWVMERTPIERRYHPKALQAGEQLDTLQVIKLTKLVLPYVEYVEFQ